MPDAVDHPANQEAHHDEDTALRDDGWDSTGPVETCDSGTRKVDYEAYYGMTIFGLKPLNCIVP